MTWITRIITDKTKKIGVNRCHPRHPCSINPLNDLINDLLRKSPTPQSPSPVILKRRPVQFERPDGRALLIAAALHCDFKGGFTFDDATVVMANRQGRTAKPQT
ncbi:MAG TPA: hypothetical protein VFY40_08390 [Blastocatellia bacterium]|nr:hypothetical protein [Blastocatellia bacterium]